MVTGNAVGGGWLVIWLAGVVMTFERALEQESEALTPAL